MVQLAYYAPPDTEPPIRRGAPLPGWISVRGAAELHHGYTLDHLHHIARRAVSASLARAMDYTDRLEAAWSGVIEHLYTSEERPSSLSLIQAGETAISRMIRTEHHHHGYAGRDSYAGPESAWNYQRYWWSTPAPSPENRVVELVSLWQIWGQLSDKQREVLAALAAHGDYQAAADALGITLGTFHVHVSKARKAFYALWHQGEEPSRVWGTDRRVGRRDATEPAKAKRRAATRAVARRVGRPKTELVHGRASTYNNHACRCAPCTQAAAAKARERSRANGAKPRRGVTVTQLADIRRRNDAGESLRSIAADLGFADSYISRLLSGKRQPTPDPVGADS
jgi:DNA-directed RNA polymerase specialized sigma24 family protein